MEANCPEQMIQLFVQAQIEGLPTIGAILEALQLPKQQVMEHLLHSIHNAIGTPNFEREVAQAIYTGITLGYYYSRKLEELK